MSDLEITRLCAEAMRLTQFCPHTTPQESQFGIYCDDASQKGYFAYEPTINDAQCLALVKRFRLHIHSFEPWRVSTAPQGYGGNAIENADLNRAICECVAKMQQAKAGSESAHSLNAQAAQQRAHIKGVCHNTTSNAKPCVNMKFLHAKRADHYRCDVCGLTEVRS